MHPKRTEAITEQIKDGLAPAKSRATGLTRRSVGLATAGLVAAAAGGSRLAAEEKHEHSQSQGAGDHNSGTSHKALIQSALHCVNEGEVCLNHCMNLLGAGDTSLKD